MLETDGESHKIELVFYRAKNKTFRLCSEKLLAQRAILAGTDELIANFSHRDSTPASKTVTNCSRHASDFSELWPQSSALDSIILTSDVWLIWANKPFHEKVYRDSLVVMKGPKWQFMSHHSPCGRISWRTNDHSWKEQRSLMAVPAAVQTTAWRSRK